MPFTASHPAAVIPLTRWGLPPSALVIGSMAPDLPAMLPIPAVVHLAHTPLGLVTLDVAVGVAAFVVWQAFLAPALVAVSPAAWRARLPPLSGPALSGVVPVGLGRWVQVVMAVLLGVATHLIWDGFTHDWMWGADTFPWLLSRHGPLLGWQWMQHISDVVGLAVVGGWVALWWRRTPARLDGAVVAVRVRAVAWAAILGPPAICFGVLLLRDSFYIAITRATALAVVGLAGVAVCLRRQAPRP